MESTLNRAVFEPILKLLGYYISMPCQIEFEAVEQRCFCKFTKVALLMDIQYPFEQLKFKQVSFAQKIQSYTSNDGKYHVIIETPQMFTHNVTIERIEQ